MTRKPSFMRILYTSRGVEPNLQPIHCGVFLFFAKQMTLQTQTTWRFVQLTITAFKLPSLQSDQHLLVGEFRTSPLNDTCAV